MPIVSHVHSNVKRLLRSLSYRGQALWPQAEGSFGIPVDLYVEVVNKILNMNARAPCIRHGGRLDESRAT